MLALLGLLALPLVVPLPQAGDPLAPAVQHALEFSATQLAAATLAFSTSRYPSTTTDSGAWATTGPGDWTSGFFPGSLWLLFEWSGAARWRSDGEAWLVALAGESDDTSTHDVGFKIFPSFGNAYRLTGDDAKRLVVLEGAASLATRYSAAVRATRSWDGPTSADFRVIIDNMMNLEILFFGARNGGNPAWYDMAVSHALTTRAHHVRADGSTYQVVNFDPSTGAVKSKGTHQGLDDESTWSRGQAWAVYGFTMAHRESGDIRFLETARATADYFLAHLPSDSVPYWDFELPSPSGEPRDSSAAAIAAAGLLELARLDPDVVRADRWLAGARAILTSLTGPAYLAEGSGEASILLHATQNRPDGRADTGLVYGDHYFLQALLRYQRWFALAPVATPLAVETTPATPVEVRLAAADSVECELTFSIVTAPQHGTLGVLTGESCSPGTPNRDAARVVYFPDPGFEGLDLFSYRASDGAHASEPAQVTIDVRSTSVPTVFLATADTKVNSDSPGRNYGTETTLRLRAPSPEWRTYLRFQVSGLSGAVTDARLRLFASDGSDSAGRVFAVPSTWSESGLTWSNAPVPAGSPLATAGAVADGAWVEFDVGALVTGNGTFSFALTSTSTNSAYFSSREGTHPPELVLTSGTPPADTTPPSVVARTPAAGATNVPRTTDVTATFDEPVLGVTGTTFVLRQGAANVAAAVAYDPATRRATLDPLAELAASTLYTATLTAGITDEAATPNALVSLSWSFTTASAPPPVLLFLATADTKVNSDSPGRNYGTETTLRLRAPSPEWRTYLRFQVSGLSGTVTGARLRLFASDGSDSAGRVFAVPSTWSESGLTWSNAPVPAGSPLATAGAVADGAWVEFDVGALVTGNGTFSFALTSTSTNSAYFSSREGTHPPELVLTSGTPPADTAPPHALAPTPVPWATGVMPATNVTVTFDEPVIGVNASTFLLRRDATAVAASVTYEPATRRATLDPFAELAPSTLYTATLGAGITDVATPPNALVPLSWSFTTASAPPPVLLFLASADSKVNSDSPGKNYGTETTLRVRSGNPEWRTYVKFQLSGLVGTVTRARLRLYASDGSDDAGRVFTVANSWSESGLTWSNAPPLVGNPLAVGGAVANGAWVEFDVTAVVHADGISSFALSSGSTNSAYFSAREGAHPPELVVEVQPSLVGRAGARREPARLE